MTATPFLKPRITGPRFAGGAIPLEVLAHFAVLSEMILEVAKWKYRQQNTERKRVPRGFSDGISLECRNKCKKLQTWAVERGWLYRAN